MQILSAEIADALQYFTFPLELIGISLAFIEIRFPKTAARWSNYIVTTDKEEDKSLTKEVSPTYFFNTVVIAIIASVAIVYSGEDIWVYIMTAVLAFVALTFTVAARWVPSHAIGTIGLALASLGLLGELYQLVVQISL